MELHEIIYLQGVASRLAGLAEKHNALSAEEAERLKGDFRAAASVLLELLMKTEEARNEN